MRTVWQTRESDMALAREIIEQFTRQNQGKLRLLDEVQEDSDGFKIRLSPWVDCLAARLRMKYGETVFPFILSNVIQELLSHHGQSVLSKNQAKLFTGILHSVFHYPESSIH